MRCRILAFLAVPLVLAQNMNDYLVESTPMLRRELNPRANGTCGPRSAGKGPVSDPDNVYAFLNNEEIKSLATNVSTPPGYKLSYQNLHAASSATDYLGYITLDSYNVENCTKSCNEKEGCHAVNVYFQRDPTLDVGSKCSDPPSTTNIKCAFWGGAVKNSNAINTGYTDNEFVVAIAGSNGYVQANSTADIKSSIMAISSPGYTLLFASLLSTTIWINLPSQHS